MESNIIYNTDCLQGLKQLPDSKTAKSFSTPYHVLYMKLFCKDMEEYRLHFEQRLFADEVDIKKWLEDYFGIDL